MLQVHMDPLYRVFRDFYTLTNIRIVLLDGDFRELLSYPEARSAFCGMIRTDRQTDGHCSRSDRGGCLRCAETGELVVYRCHAGLTEAVVPIRDRSGILGYVMFGQILPSGEGTRCREHLRRRFPESRFPGIADAIGAIPLKTDEELSAAGTVLQALTAYVLTNRWINPEKSEFIRRLDHFIGEHLDSVTVDDLCRAFHMGRTRLYSVFADYLHCGPAEYIRRSRILHARQLLSETDRTVSDIAYAVGFADYNHFSRIFKQQCGMSARQYRSVHRKESVE